ncbi:hypothetical protein GRX31_29455, partial [Delftia sp. CH05]|nr:hypothetical protein [Delftia sp. CH05]
MCAPSTANTACWYRPPESASSEPRRCLACPRPGAAMTRSLESTMMSTAATPTSSHAPAHAPGVA